MMAPSSSNSEDDIRQKLDHQLNMIIGSFDAPMTVRRQTVTQFLDTIAIGLNKNNQVDDDDDAADDVDDRGEEGVGGKLTTILRQGLSSLLQYIGPRNEQLRNFLLDQLTLDRKISASSRQILLDFLPTSMPLEGVDKMQLVDQCNQELVDAMWIVVKKDPSSAVLPVMCCFRKLPLTDIGRKESFLMALQSLDYISDNDLPALVGTMLDQTNSEEETISVLKATRTKLVELMMGEESPNNSSSREAIGGMTIQVVLDAILDDQNDNRNARAYCSLLDQNIASNHTTIHDDDDDDDGREEEKKDPPFLLLDLAVVITLHHQHPDFMDICERRLDPLLVDNLFPFDTLSDLIQLVCKHKDTTARTLYQRLVEPLVSMGIFLMLTPARLWGGGHYLSRRSCSRILNQSQYCLLTLHGQVGRDAQTDIVHTLLQLSDAFATKKWISSAAAKPKKKPQSKKRPLPPRKWEQLSTQSSLITTDDQGEDVEESNQWSTLLRIGDCVYSTLQDLARTSRHTFSNSKHILIDRLTKMSMTSMMQWERRSMQHLCGILSILFETPSSASSSTEQATATSGGIQTSEMLNVLQKLLFTSSSYSANKSSRFCNRRVIRGLLLATELVQSPCITREDLDCVKQWVLRILLPTTRRMVDPEVGTPGLDFLEAIMVDREDGKPTLQLKREAFQHLKMILANTGLVQILAFYQQQQKQSQNTRRRNDASSTLAYTAKPRGIFQTASAGKRKKRDMVFCLAFFLRNSDLHLPSRWNDSVEWVFHLTRIYLRIGREISLSSASTHGKAPSNNWVPHGWLQAAIEYPALVFPTEVQPETKKQQSAVDWAKSIFSGDPSSSTPGFRLSEIKSGLVELLLMRENIGHLCYFLESLLRLGSSSLLGVSLSFAVVENAFEHYESLSRNHEGSMERMETLRLIQFQMAKIYDMEQKMGRIECLMKSSLTCLQKLVRQQVPQQDHDGLSQEEEAGVTSSLAGTTNCTQSAPSETMETTRHILKSHKRLQEQMVQALNKINFLKRQLFTSVNFIGPGILFQSLVDDEQDGLIMEAVDSIMLSQSLLIDTNFETVRQVLSIRHSILNHLASILVRDAAGEVDKKHIILSEVDRAAKCADFGLYLCSKMPKLRAAICAYNGEEDRLDMIKTLVDSISTLAESYLQIIFLWLTTARDDGTQECSILASQSQTQKSSMSVSLEACSNALLSRGILSESDRSSPNKTTFVFAGFLLLLQDCEYPAIANRLLEILSVVGTSGIESTPKSLLTASWNALNTVYGPAKMKQENLQMRPFALVECLKRNSMQSSSSFCNSMESCLSDTVLKPTGGTAHGNGRIRRSLLRHWGVAALFPAVTETGIDHLLAVFDELSALLNTIDNHPNSSRNGEEKKEDSISFAKHKNQEEQGSSTHGYGIPDLHETSFPVGFETLLHIAVSGIGILRLGSNEGTKETGPYIKFVKLLYLFSSLLELYQERAHLFPGSTKSIIVVATKHMLAAIVERLGACIAWRNNQPYLSTSVRAKGVYDQGAVGYLQDFIDECWKHIIVKVLRYCEFMRPVARSNATKRQRASCTRWRQRGDEDNNSDDNSYLSEDNRVGPKATDWRASDRGHAKASGLRYAVEKVAQTFMDTASDLNMTTPAAFTDESVGAQKGSGGCAARPRKRHHKEVGFHQLDRSEKDRQVADVLKSYSRSSNKLRRLCIEEDSEDEDGGDDNNNNNNLVGKDKAKANTKAIQSTKRRISLGDDPDENSVGEESSEENCDSVDLEMDSVSNDGTSDDDDDDDDDSGSFCATGKWGEDGSDASSSSGTLKLEGERPLYLA